MKIIPLRVITPALLALAIFQSDAASTNLILQVNLALTGFAQSPFGGPIAPFHATTKDLIASLSGRTLTTTTSTNLLVDSSTNSTTYYSTNTDLSGCGTPISVNNATNIQICNYDLATNTVVVTNQTNMVTTNLVFTYQIVTNTYEVSVTDVTTLPIFNFLKDKLFFVEELDTNGGPVTHGLFVLDGTNYTRVTGAFPPTSDEDELSIDVFNKTVDYGIQLISFDNQAGRQFTVDGFSITHLGKVSGPHLKPISDEFISSTSQVSGTGFWNGFNIVLRGTLNLVSPKLSLRPFFPDE